MSNEPSSKLPWQKWSWPHWFGATDVQSLEPEARCLWFEMIGLMWTSEEPGFLVRNGKPLTKEKLSRTIHKFTREKFEAAFQAIEDEKLFSIRETDGAIYSRKMVRDLEIHERQAELGRKGAKATWGDKAKVNAEPTPEEIAKVLAKAKAMAVQDEPVGVTSAA